MFNSPIIDLVILLSFTYFVGSIMLTAINESIAALLRLRAKSLKHTLEHLIFSADWTAFVKKVLILSPHIQSLQNNPNKYPSYIPAKNFVLTIIEQIKANNYTEDKIEEGINSSVLPIEFKKVLLDILAKAKAKKTETITIIHVFEDELEAFYNSAMDRATGWYKRRTRRILLALGFVLAILLNLDTIGIANAVLQDKNKLKTTVDNIVNQLNKINYNDSVITISDTTGGIVINQVFKIDSLQDANGIVKQSKSNVSNLSIYYKQTTDIVLGYKDWDEAKRLWLNLGNKPDANKNGLMLFLIKLMGILITAFALQLGSNYWFDILNKAVNIRAAGKKPEEDKK